MNSTFSAAIQRRRYWKHEVGTIRRCPECQGPLTQDTHAYLVDVKDGCEEGSFVSQHNGGYFCATCPVVVLDREEVVQGLAAAQVPQGAWFQVVGIIDFEDVPEEKAHLPLGDPDNPVPIVEFLNLNEGSMRAKPSGGKAKKRRMHGKKSKKRKKHR